MSAQARVATRFVGPAVADTKGTSVCWDMAAPTASSCDQHVRDARSSLSRPTTSWDFINVPLMS